MKSVFSSHLSVAHVSENVQCSSSVTNSRSLISVLKRRHPRQEKCSIASSSNQQICVSSSLQYVHVVSNLVHPKNENNSEDPSWESGGKRGRTRGRGRGNMKGSAKESDRGRGRGRAPRSVPRMPSNRGRGRGRRRIGIGPDNDIPEASAPASALSDAIQGELATAVEVLAFSMPKNSAEETTEKLSLKEEGGSFVAAMQNKVSNSVQHIPEPEVQTTHQFNATQMYGISGPKLIERDPDLLALTIDERSTTPLSVHGDSSRCSLFPEVANFTCESLSTQTNESQLSCNSFISKSNLKGKFGAGSLKSLNFNDNECKPSQQSEYSPPECLPRQTTIDNQFRVEEYSKQKFSATYPYSYHSVIQYGGSSGTKVDSMVECDSQWASASTSHSAQHQFHENNHFASDFLREQPKPLLYPNPINLRNVTETYSEYANNPNNQSEQYTGSCSPQQNQHQISCTQPQFSSTTVQQFSNFQERIESSHCVEQKPNSQQSVSSRNQPHTLSNPNYNSAFMPSDNYKFGNGQTQMHSAYQVAETVTSSLSSGSPILPEDQESPLVNFTKLMYSE